MQEQPSGPARQEPSVVVALRERFPEAVEEFNIYRGQLTVRIRPADLYAVCVYLRDEPEWRFTLLADLCGVDMLRLRDQPRFDVVYQLYSVEHNRQLRLKAGVDEWGSVDSVTPIWPGGDWQEREAYDMFGIIFDGHPDLRRILLPDDWHEFPLRKDVAQEGNRLEADRWLSQQGVPIRLTE